MDVDNLGYYLINVNITSVLRKVKDGHFFWSVWKLKKQVRKHPDKSGWTLVDFCSSESNKMLVKEPSNKQYIHARFFRDFQNYL